MNKTIKKIELDLGGKTVTLTPKQAQNLKDALDDLFGKEIVKVIEKEYIRDSYPVPYPVFPRRPYYPIWKYQPTYYDRITCGGTVMNHNFDNGTLSLTVKEKTNVPAIR